MFRHSRIACCLSVVLSLGGSELFLHAQPPSGKAAPVEKVLADWKHRLQRFKSVRYVVSGKTEKKDLPAGSKVRAVRPVKFVVLIDLVKGRVRVEKTSSGFNPTEE